MILMKERHREQRDGMQDPEISSGIFDWMIFWQRCQGSALRMCIFFEQLLLGKLAILMQDDDTGP